MDFKSFIKASSLLIALLPATVGCLASFTCATSSAQAGARQYTICIDPGHPSEVGRGTAGKHISEIHAAWVVAMKLRDVLVARGMRVVLTKRSENQFVRNRARAEIANDAHADFMVRLHCDANAGSGIACYAPDRQGVAAGVRGPAQLIIKESQAMGRVFHKTLIGSLKGALIDRDFLPDTMTAVGGKQGALTGSIFSRVPVVLIEMCVLTNPVDERFILQPKNQDLLASAIADGIVAALKVRADGPGAD
jgi:N-acetylmuramoyl-L-alanine amidase